MKIRNASWGFISLITGFLAYGTTFIVLGNEMTTWPVHLAAALRLIFLACFMVHGIQKNKLTTWIFFAMLAGIEFGYMLPEFGKHLNIISKIFIKLIKTIIAPLLFGTLVIGIAGHGDIKQVGRMGWKSLLYFEIVTTIALFIGLGAANWIMPGSGIDPELWKGISAEKTSAPMSGEETILHIFPENIAKAIAEGNVLQVVIFSVLFGIAMIIAKDQAKQKMLGFAESLTEIMFEFTSVVMKLAPLAVGAAMAATVSQMGLGVLKNLFILLGALYISLFVLILVVFIPVALIIKLPLKRFFQAVAEPVTVAFATTSSESALPRAMTALEKFGIPRKIVSFVLPTGYSFNLDGTTLYLALATMFCAQATGIYLNFPQQLLIVFSLMLTSKGVAGVPRASLVILTATLGSFNIPTAPVYLILGIDALMDMGRTATNVLGNCLAAAVVAKWEKEDQWNENVD